MRLIFVMTAMLSGCVDYNKLSDAKPDGSTIDTIHEPGLDLGGVGGDAGGVDGSGEDAGTSDAAQASADMAQAVSGDMTVLPATCQEINDDTVAANDGNFVLYYNHDAAKQWVVYCKGMGPGGHPIEYLTLPEGGANNEAIIGADLQAYSKFDKVRIDPVTLLIDVTDGTYNTTPPGESYGCTVGDKVMPTLIPLGLALAYCGTNNGTATIDLRGTPFAVAQGAFGLVNGATATYSNADQTVALLASGVGAKGSVLNNKLQIVMP